MLPESIFARKRFMITDDMVDMRSAIKRMVEVIGGQPQNIEINSNGEEAILSLMKNKFDIVLCDYSLGEGKDGQQVLEEARYRDILPHSCIFMLLTAESAAEMVMGALEYEPDGYLVKPFTKDMFHQRLEKVIQKKVRLGQIYKALDQKDPDKALIACDKFLAENPANGALACKKLKATILLDLNRIEEAKTIYKQVLTEKEVPWAQHGLGKVYYYQERYDEAVEVFEKMISQSQLCLSLTNRSTVIT
jgi:DNA-binding NarL/FixJ family response regulator